MGVVPQGVVASPLHTRVRRRWRATHARVRRRTRGRQRRAGLRRAAFQDGTCLQVYLQAHAIMAVVYLPTLRSIAWLGCGLDQDPATAPQKAKRSRPQTV